MAAERRHKVPPSFPVAFMKNRSHEDHVVSGFEQRSQLDVGIRQVLEKFKGGHQVVTPVGRRLKSFCEDVRCKQIPPTEIEPTIAHRAYEQSGSCTVVHC